MRTLPLSLILCASMSALLACSSGATGGTEGSASTGSTGGSGGSTSSTTTSSTGGSGGGGGAPAADGIALLDSEVPASVDTSKWLSAGEKLDANTMIVVIDTLGEACTSPRFDDGTMNHAMVVVGLLSNMQTPGTYAFSSTEVIAWGSTWLGDGMGNGGGGSGPLMMGSIQVVSVNIVAGTIDVSLSGLPSDLMALEGAHTVHRCP